VGAFPKIGVPTGGDGVKPSPAFQECPSPMAFNPA